VTRLACGFDGSIGLRRLREEVFDQTTVVIFFDSGEQFRPEFSDRCGLIERLAIVHLTTTKMTRHALRLEDWL
jgi:hypothetical protein